MLDILFCFDRLFDDDAFHTKYSRWQIPTVYDFKDRHYIQAWVLGLIGMNLGGLALARSRHSRSTA